MQRLPIKLTIMHRQMHLKKLLLLSTRLNIQMLRLTISQFQVRKLLPSQRHQLLVEPGPIQLTSLKELFLSQHLRTYCGQLIFQQQRMSTERNIKALRQARTILIQCIRLQLETLSNGIESRLEFPQEESYLI